MEDYKKLYEMACEQALRREELQRAEFQKVLRVYQERVAASDSGLIYFTELGRTLKRQSLACVDQADRLAVSLSLASDLIANTVERVRVELRRLHDESIRELAGNTIMVGMETRLKLPSVRPS